MSLAAFALAAAPEQTVEWLWLLKKVSSGLGSGARSKVAAAARISSLLACIKACQLTHTACSPWMPAGRELQRKPRVRLSQQVSTLCMLITAHLPAAHPSDHEQSLFTCQYQIPSCIMPASCRS